MRLHKKSLSLFVAVGIILNPSAAGAFDSGKRVEAILKAVETRQAPAAGYSRSFAKVLSDHPGAATALTAEQKQEIESVVARSGRHTHLVCTGVSLSGQRESMYRVVRLRAQLVCDYAKSLNPNLRTVVRESFTPGDQFNGRVVVLSR